MAGAKKGIADTVSDLIRNTVAEKGCRLWDVEYVKEGARHILRVTIDRDGGIDIDCCESVHRAIDPILDEADPIAESYYLEVSSPGVERELKTPAHFAEFIGSKVDVKLFAVFDGVKQFTGILEDYDAGEDAVTVSGKTIKRDKISKISLHYDFEI